LVLAQVAREAGFARGALYHRFREKDELVLAWRRSRVHETLSVGTSAIGRWLPGASVAVTSPVSG
jgi:AcrR family transcriptional regulator